MTEHRNTPDPELVAMESKAKEMTRLLLALTEKRLSGDNDKEALTPERRALGASALALQKAIDAFLAVEKLCE